MTINDANWIVATISTCLAFFSVDSSQLDISFFFVSICVWLGLAWRFLTLELSSMVHHAAVNILIYKLPARHCRQVVSCLPVRLKLPPRSIICTQTPLSYRPFSPNAHTTTLEHFLQLFLVLLAAADQHKPNLKKCFFFVCLFCFVFLTRKFFTWKQPNE